MNFIYENNKKYIDINYIAEFLEYKRINTFISNCLKKATTTIKNSYVEVKEAVILLINNKRDKVAELINIMLTETQQEEINDIIDEFNEITNKEFEWIDELKEMPRMLINMWYITSAKNINIINEISFNKYLDLYRITESELDSLFVQYMQNCPYVKGDE